MPAFVCRACGSVAGLVALVAHAHAEETTGRDSELAAPAAHYRARRRSGMINLARGGVEDRNLAPATHWQRPRTERGKLVDRTDVQPFADRAHAATSEGVARGRISARCWWSL